MYLDSGYSFSILMYTFNISKQSISMTVPEVCEAFIAALQRIRESKSIYYVQELNYFFCTFLNSTNHLHEKSKNSEHY